MKFCNWRRSLARNLLRLALCMVVLMTGGLSPAVSGLPVDTEKAMAGAQSSADLKAFIGIAIDGGGLVYPITVINQGPDMAPNVTVTLPLPQGVAFASVNVGLFPPRPVRCTTPQSGSTGDVVCALGDFHPNERADIFINVYVVGAPGTKLATEAHVTSDATDPDPTNNTMKYETIIPPLPKIVSVRSLADPFRLEIVGENLFTPQFGGSGFGIGCDCKDWAATRTTGDTTILEGGKDLKRLFPKGITVQLCYRDQFRNTFIRAEFTR